MVKDLLIDKTPSEKADIKGNEFAKLSAIPKTERAEYHIEISKPEAVKGGFQVFARAWDKNNKPIGFGKDGTVETERFVYINPKIFVRDPLGDIDQSWTDRQGNLHEVKVREDLQEAMLQALERTIKSVGKNGKNIIPGSVGNTTTTVNETNGGTSEANNSTNFATMRADSGDSANPGGWEIDLLDPASNFVRMSVGNGHFDTSAITDTDTITSATANFYLIQEGSDLTVYLTSASTASINANDAEAHGVYTNHLTTHTTKYSDDSLSNSGMTVNNWYNFALNAAGLAAISKTGTTYLGMTSANDFDNSEPSGDANRISNFSGSDGSEEPYLEVIHSAVAAAPPSSTLLLMGAG